MLVTRRDARDTSWCSFVMLDFCYIPEEDLRLQQWENRAQSTLLQLPAPSTTCSNIISNISLVLRKPDSRAFFGMEELPVALSSRTSSRVSFSVPAALDRETLDSSVSYDLNCHLEDQVRLYVFSCHLEDQVRLYIFNCHLEDQVRLYVFSCHLENQTNTWARFEEQWPVNLKILDEDDSAPYRYKHPSVTWSIMDNHLELNNMLTVLDADNFDSNDYCVSIEGNVDGIVYLESVNKFEINSVHCRNASSSLQKAFHASCTFISPVLQFNTTAIPAWMRELTFSVVYEDRSVLPLVSFNKTAYNVTLLLSSSSSLEEDHDGLGGSSNVNVSDEELRDYLRTHSSVSASVNKPIPSYSRLAQVIPPQFASSLLEYHQQLPQPQPGVPTTDLSVRAVHPMLPEPAYRTANEDPKALTVSNSSVKSGIFSLASDSLNKGVSVTPILGILYVSDVDLLQSALDAATIEGTELQIEILRRDVTVKSSSDDGKGDRNDTFGDGVEIFDIWLTWSPSYSSCLDMSTSFPPTPENLPAPTNLQTCSSITYGNLCESTCGLATAASGTGSCQWRAYGGSGTSTRYATCSPDLNTCPDGICDELEQLLFKICPQDCAVASQVKGQYHELNRGGAGIARGLGVCSCDTHCTCFPAEETPPAGRGDDYDLRVPIQSSEELRVKTSSPTQLETDFQTLAPHIIVPDADRESSDSVPDSSDRRWICDVVACLRMSIGIPNRQSLEPVAVGEP
ncbi:hypothetical protein FHG87_006811 [Trinorchestia longiramus]|nr:hypothetical protein FHG87_006811 [Trinorchestia longiramus]